MTDKSKKQKNPFYTLLIWVGIVFAITATSYGVMTVTHLKASEEITELSDPTETFHPLFRFLDENGFDLMLAELGLLGVLTFAAIAYDEVHEIPNKPSPGQAAEEVEGRVSTDQDDGEVDATDADGDSATASVSTDQLHQSSDA